MMWLLVLVGLTCGRGGAAEGLRLARVISSSMVMQAEMPALSGWADPGSTVSLTTSDGERHSVAAATSDGAFTISMAPREAKIADEGIGITVASGGKTINLTDILFGDVWLCSGTCCNSQWTIRGPNRPAVVQVDQQWSKTTMLRVDQ